jgi:hypothetical protein
VDEGMNEEVKITIIATGFSAQKEKPKVSSVVPVAAAMRQPARAPSEPSELPRPLARRSPSRELRPEAPLSGLAPNTGLPPPSLEEQYDIPAFLRRNPPKGE